MLNFIIALNPRKINDFFSIALPTLTRELGKNRGPSPTEGAKPGEEDRVKKSVGFRFSSLPKLDFPAIVGIKERISDFVSGYLQKAFSFYPIASLINL
jgi:hypothetical protein